MNITTTPWLRCSRLLRQQRQARLVSPCLKRSLQVRPAAGIQLL